MRREIRHFFVSRDLFVIFICFWGKVLSVQMLHSANSPKVVQTMSTACSMLEAYDTEELASSNTIRFLSQLLRRVDVDKNVVTDFEYWRKAFISAQGAKTREDLKLLCTKFVCVPHAMRYPIADAVMKATINLIQKKLYWIVTQRSTSIETQLHELECMQSLLKEIAGDRGETVEQMLDRVEKESKIQYS